MINDNFRVQQFWYSRDTEARFDKHQKNKVTRLQLKELNWTKDSIVYQFNKYGFRSDSFSDAPGAMFMGCSITLGVGLPFQNTWPYLVSKKLNLRCWNLSQPGGSLDACYRLAKYWVPILKPKYIFILAPSMYRREFYDDDADRFLNIGTWSQTYIVREIVESEKNNIINHDKNIDAIKFISNSYKIPLILQDTQSNNTPSIVDPLEKYKLARDLSHPGIDYHACVSNDFLNLM